MKLGMGLGLSRRVAASLYPVNAFVTTWLTTTPSETITLPATNAGTYNATVDWGDGSTSTITTFDDADLAHVYADIGTYTVQVTGTYPAWRFNNAGDRLKIQTVEQWGAIGTLYFAHAFLGCANLLVNATDALDLSGVSISSASAAFRNCTALTSVPSYESFNFTGMTDMSLMFMGCANYNGPAQNATTSSVTNFANYLYACTSFNQPLALLDTSSCNTMSFMFYNADGFDQDISGWDVTALTAGTSFMLSANGLSTANYDLLLVGWEGQLVQNNVSIDFGGSIYSAASAAATARAALISDHTWTIVDGGSV